MKISVDVQNELPVTDNSCISQQFKDPQQLQSEKIPPLSTFLVLKAESGCHFTATKSSGCKKTSYN